MSLSSSRRSVKLMILLDESGYSFNWLNEIDSQPFYVAVSE